MKFNLTFSLSSSLAWLFIKKIVKDEAFNFPFPTQNCYMCITAFGHPISSKNWPLKMYIHQNVPQNFFHEDFKSGAWWGRKKKIKEINFSAIPSIGKGRRIRWCIKWHQNQNAISSGNSSHGRREILFYFYVEWCAIEKEFELKIN